MEYVNVGDNSYDRVAAAISRYRLAFRESYCLYLFGCSLLIAVHNGVCLLMVGALELFCM